MIFDYKSLKRAASEGQRLGNWKGKAVFAASAAKLDSLASGAYYIVYDDDNKIVSRSASNGQWRCHGKVTVNGNVEEYGTPQAYITLDYSQKVLQTSGMRYSSEPVPEAVVKVTYAVPTTYSPGYDRTERPVGDVKTEIDVEATLKRAREMTVADLLEGLNFGVDVAKG